jgi:ferredoxin
MSVKVTIDEDACTACGLCYNDECPEIFEEGSDGNSNLKKEFQKGGIDKGEIPDDKKECAEKAAEACPVTAIVVG